MYNPVALLLAKKAVNAMLCRRLSASGGVVRQPINRVEFFNLVGTTF